MATDTVSSDHPPPTASEQAEKVVHEEVKTMEGESVPLTKDNEVKPNEEDSLSPVVKIEDTKSESMAIEEPTKNDDEKVDNEEKPNAEEPSQVITEEVKKADEDVMPIADEAAPVIVEEVKKDDEVEKPTIEAAPPSAIIEEVKSTDEEEKQKADEPQVLEIEDVKKPEEQEKPKADEPQAPTIVEEVKKAEEEEKPKADEPIPTIVEEVKTADENPTMEEPPPPIVEEVKKIDEEEKPKADEPTLVEEVKKADEEEKPTTIEEPPVTIIEEAKKSIEEEKPIADEPLPPTVEEVTKVDEPQAPPATTHEEEKPKAEELPSIDEIADKGIEPPTIEEVKKQDETPIMNVTSKDLPELTKEPSPEPEAQVADVTKSELEVQAEVGTVEILDRESKVEPVEEKTEQQPKTVDIVEPSFEAEVPKSEPKGEVSEPAPIVEEKPTEVTEGVTGNEVIPVEKAPKEEPVSTTLETLMQKADEESPAGVAADNAVIEEKEKELVPEATVAEAPAKEGQVENVERELKDVKTDEQDDKEEKSVVTEELTAPEAKGVEKGPEVEIASRDIEPITEIGKSTKDETIPTTEAAEVEKKVDEATANATDESSVEEAKDEKTAEVEENAKTEGANKDGEDKKTTEEVPVKTKQSNNLMSKVKQSLVKAKKAIIGSSKSDTTKNEVKTK